MYEKSTKSLTNSSTVEIEILILAAKYELLEYYEVWTKGCWNKDKRKYLTEISINVLANTHTYRLNRLELVLVS